MRSAQPSATRRSHAEPPRHVKRQRVQEGNTQSQRSGKGAAWRLTKADSSEDELDAAQLLLSFEEAPGCCNRACGRRVTPDSKRRLKLHSIPLPFSQTTPGPTPRVCSSCYVWTRRHFHLYRGDAAAAHHKKCGQGRRTLHCERMLQGFRAAGVVFSGEGPCEGKGAADGAVKHVATKSAAVAHDKCAGAASYSARVSAAPGHANHAELLASEGVIRADRVVFRAPVMLGGAKVSTLQDLLDNLGNVLGANQGQQRHAPAAAGLSVATGLPRVPVAAAWPHSNVLAQAAAAPAPPTTGLAMRTVGGSSAVSATTKTGAASSHDNGASSRGGASTSEPSSEAPLQSEVQTLSSRVTAVENAVRVHSRVLRHVATSSRKTETPSLASSKPRQQQQQRQRQVGAAAVMYSHPAQQARIARMHMLQQQQQQQPPPPGGFVTPFMYQAVPRDMYVLPQ